MLRGAARRPSTPDGRKRKALAAPGTLRGADDARRRRSVVLERYERDPATGRRTRRRADRSLRRSRRRARARLVSVGVRRAGASRMCSIRSRSRRGEQVDARSRAAAASSVPDGFIYVPPGEFWFGDADEQLRTQFLDTVPIHRRATGRVSDRAARDHLRGVDPVPERAAPGRARARTRPTSRRALRGFAAAARRDAELAAHVPAGTQRYMARGRGADRATSGRKQRARQDWLRFPVAGISPADAERYVAWLRTHRTRAGRAVVHGARMGARRARRRRSPVSARRRARRRRRELRRDVRAGRFGVRARRRRLASRRRAARSASTIWRATCSSLPSRRRSRTRSYSRRRLLLQIRQLPQHQPRAGSADVSRRDDGNPDLRVCEGENDVTSRKSKHSGHRIACVVVPARSRRRRSRRGISAQGISAQGITAQGMTAQGISAQGISAQGSDGARDLGAGDLGAGDLRRRGSRRRGSRRRGSRRRGSRRRGSTAQGI